MRDAIGAVPRSCEATLSPLARCGLASAETWAGQELRPAATHFTLCKVCQPARNARNQMQWLRNGYEFHAMVKRLRLQF
jgi:hypothetical protein